MSQVNADCCCHWSLQLPDCHGAGRSDSSQLNGDVNERATRLCEEE